MPDDQFPIMKLREKIRLNPHKIYQTQSFDSKDQQDINHYLFCY